MHRGPSEHVAEPRLCTFLRINIHLEGEEKGAELRKECSEVIAGKTFPWLALPEFRATSPTPDERGALTLTMASTRWRNGGCHFTDFCNYLSMSGRFSETDKHSYRALWFTPRKVK